MCFQDWRIGRLIRTKSTALSITSATPATIAANPQRVAITFSGVATAGTLLVAPFDTPQSAGAAVIALGFEPWHVTLQNNGDLPTKQFTVSHTGIGTVIGGYIEYLAPEWLIAADPEKIKAMLDAYRG